MFHESSVPKVNSASNIKTGELAGATSATQLPNVPCTMVEIVARSDNSGSVYIGASSSMTVADGTTDTTTGVELDAGQGRYFFVSNLNLLYRRCDNAGDDVTYIAYV